MSEEDEVKFGPFVPLMPICSPQDTYIYTPGGRGWWQVIRTVYKAHQKAKHRDRQLINQYKRSRDQFQDVIKCPTDFNKTIDFFMYSNDQRNSNPNLMTNINAH